MGVRVKIRVSLGRIHAETVALANSGFETETPQLLVPYAFLSKINVDLPSLGRPLSVEYDTAGGSIAMSVYPRACRVSVVEEDKTTSEVETDLVVSPVEREALMSDALMEELGIVILSPKRGLWRLVDDPLEKVRNSYKPQYW